MNISRDDNSGEHHAFTGKRTRDSVDHNGRLWRFFSETEKLIFIHIISISVNSCTKLSALSLCVMDYHISCSHYKEWSYPLFHPFVVRDGVKYEWLVCYWTSSFLISAPYLVSLEGRSWNHEWLQCEEDNEEEEEEVEIEEVSVAEMGV